MAINMLCDLHNVLEQALAESEYLDGLTVDQENRLAIY